MYCPNCAHDNLADIKFCTRCGTNLGLVSEALGRKPASTPQIEDRVVRVLKDYYRGRRDTITGLILLPAAVKAMALLMLFGMPPVPSFFIVSWMFFWGIASLASGMGKWAAASGELKALGYRPPSSKLWMRIQKLLSSGTAGGDEQPSTNYLAEPAAPPASVTETTTRELDRRLRTPQRERH